MSKLTEEQLELLYATAMTVTRRNASIKWGRPDYAACVTSADLRTLCDGAVMFVRERREAESVAAVNLAAKQLTAEEIDPLVRLRNELRNAERRSPDIMYHPPHLIEARKALDGLLSSIRDGQP